jgi:hypothetical protein
VSPIPDQTIETAKQRLDGGRHIRYVCAAAANAARFHHPRGAGPIMRNMLTSMPERAEANASVAAGIGMSTWHAGLRGAGHARFGAALDYATRGSEGAVTR